MIREIAVSSICLMRVKYACSKLHSIETNNDFSEIKIIKLIKNNDL